MRSPYMSVDGLQETALRGIDPMPTRRESIESSRMKTITPIRTQDTVLPNLFGLEMPEFLNAIPATINTKMLLIAGGALIIFWLWRKLT